MSVQDIDGDGWQDLYVSGNWTTPNHRILYGNNAFPSVGALYTLPEGPYGHTSPDDFNQPDVGFARGSDVNKVVFEDFDGDGDLDIVAAIEEILLYKPGVFEDKKHPWYPSLSESGGSVGGNFWFQVLKNEGQRQFVDVTTQGKNLGDRYYISLLPMDFDLDGDIDLVGQFWGKLFIDKCGPRWGSTIFINEGNLVFHKFEAEEVFPELSSTASNCGGLGLGVLFPTSITADGIEGLLVAPIESQAELRVLRFHATGRFNITD